MSSTHIPAHLHLRCLAATATGVAAIASIKTLERRCPRCTRPCTRGRKRYVDVLRDLSPMDTGVRLRLHTRHFLRQNDARSAPSLNVCP